MPVTVVELSLVLASAIFGLVGPLVVVWQLILVLMLVAMAMSMIQAPSVEAKVFNSVAHG